MIVKGVSTEIQQYINKVEKQCLERGYPDYHYCQRILKLAADNNSEVLFGLGYYYFAIFYFFQLDYEQTVHCLTECIKYCDREELCVQLTNAYAMLGTISVRRNNLMLALSYCYISVSYAQKYRLHDVKIRVEKDIAFILMRMKRYKEAGDKFRYVIRHYSRKKIRGYDGALVRYMLKCGICHLWLDEVEPAQKLWQELMEIREQYPNEDYPDSCFLAYQAVLEEAGGNRENAEECVDKLLLLIGTVSNIQEQMDLFLIVAALLDRMRDDERMGQLLQVLDVSRPQEYPRALLDLYPIRSKYMLRNNMTEEYMEYTRQYFEIYDQCQQDNRQMTRSVMELQDRLRAVEDEQIRIVADNKRLESIALYDPMTNLANRTYLNEYLAQRFEEAYLQQKPIGVELMDIDFFKQYNENYGHLSGDICIESVAAILREKINENIFCARYGGDEFMIVYTDMNLETISDTAKDIRRRVQALRIPHRESKCSNFVTVSQGIFFRTPREVNREWDFGVGADNALYRAKQEGRNSYVLKTEF